MVHYLLLYIYTSLFLIILLCFPVTPPALPDEENYFEKRDIEKNSQPHFSPTQGEEKVILSALTKDLYTVSNR